MEFPVAMKVSHARDAFEGLQVGGLASGQHPFNLPDVVR
jgi:hypothetical protein